MSVAPLVEIPYRIAMALTMASSATGTDYDYLLKTAARESNFRVEAKARTSSATGLFQFIKGTWLRVLKKQGPRYGLGKHADRIFITRDGRYYVPDAKDRKRILDLRQNPEAAALMAGAYTKKNENFLRGKLGQKPRSGELYIAHFLGPNDAVRLIKAARLTPSKTASRLFPKAARANRPIFYKRGRRLSVLEVYRNLVSKHETQVTTRIAAKGKTRSRSARKPANPYLRTARSTGASKHLIRAKYRRSAPRAKYASLTPAAPKLFKLRGSLSRGDSSYILRSRKAVKLSKVAGRTSRASRSSWITQTESLPQSARVLKTN